MDVSLPYELTAQDGSDDHSALRRHERSDATPLMPIARCLDPIGPILKGSRHRSTSPTVSQRSTTVPCGW
jgi:hypothetical protein